MKGDVLGSLVEFDKAIELDTRQKACKFLGILIVCFFRRPVPIRRPCGRVQRSAEHQGGVNPAKED